MAWLTNPLKKEDLHEKSIFPQVKGETVQQFKFTYTDKHWINGSLLNQNIQGQFDVAVTFIDYTTEKWDVFFNAVNFDRSKPHIPELYLLFDAVKRADFFIDNQSGLILDRLQIFNQETTLKQKIADAEVFISDKNGAKLFKVFLQRNLLNPDFAKKQLSIQPILGLLFNTIRLRKAIYHHPGVHPLAENYTKLSYFSDKHDLCIKSCWLNKPRTTETTVNTWVRTGGLDTDAYLNGPVPDLLKKLSGKVNTPNDLQMDFSETYQYKSNDHLSCAQLLFAESYLQTALSEVWFKETEITISSSNSEDYASR
ncbi:hypothetical protein [Pedobacter nutrimenti]|uniref:hypothetical protein n=1 Tax=Pedobacter nutrimenti TaxID=1241337 RepID=UPI00292DBD57|nr:hypothetical protein [Pedobacter nutrimenti]